MRELIDGQLAYATAHKGEVSPVPVDLTALAADIAVARSDSAVAVGEPEPRFTVGDLPPVQADPVLLRQLMDNVIGNAIKYTSPGTAPALTITASRTGDTVMICIADNGIGIPPGQHEAIFEKLPSRAPGQRIPRHRPRPGHLQADRGTPRRHHRRIGQPGRRLVLHVHPARRGGHGRRTGARAGQAVAGW
nr:hypothetical protein GCM10020092_032980 [Actinoplanes digitatis]